MNAAVAAPRRTFVGASTQVMATFAARYIVDPETGCWHWTSTTKSDGYGMFSAEGANGGAHRAAYQMLIGPVPGDLPLDHTCHSNDRTCLGGPTCKHRSCVNPTHLEPVTQQVNVNRGRGSAGRTPKTHCTNGHLYDETNTYISPVGHRACRICLRVASRAAKQRARTGQLFRPESLRFDTSSVLTQRRIACVSVLELAAITGVSAAAIRRAEAGTATPLASTFQTLADGLGVPLEVFLHTGPFTAEEAA